MVTRRIPSQRKAICTVHYRTRKYDVNGNHRHVWAEFDESGEVCRASDSHSGMARPFLNTVVLISHTEAKSLLYRLIAP